jgi:hypothetical protein
MRKKILLTILAILIIIQFIRPARNVSATVAATDITKVYEVPQHVQQLLQVACNDCHSNNTAYPWYTNIQPVGWWLQHHVNEGKEHLDFSVFGSYKPRRQAHKLEEVAEQVREGHMPLDSYLWIHKDAILSADDKAMLTAWAESLRERIIKENNLPAEKEEPQEKHEQH